MVVTLSPAVGRLTVSVERVANASIYRVKFAHHNCLITVSPVHGPQLPAFDAERLRNKAPFSTRQAMLMLMYQAGMSGRLSVWDTRTKQSVAVCNE